MGSRLLGVVLSGGRSARMGRDKASLPHPDGGTFLSHAVARLEGLCDQVCVAGGTAADVHAELLPDPQPHLGPAIGIATALTYAAERGFDACLVTPVDMPYLTVGDLEVVREVWTREGQICCVQSTGDDRLQPLVAVYPIACRSALQRLAESEQRSLTRWIAAQQPQLIQLTADACRNVNAPSDIDAG